MKAALLVTAVTLSFLVGCEPIKEIVTEAKDEVKASSQGILEEKTGIKLDELNLEQVLEAKEQLAISTYEETKEAAIAQVDEAVSDTLGTSLSSLENLTEQDLEQQVNDVIKQKKAELAQWLLDGEQGEEQTQ
ncbi:hypothetical protein [Motilimonas eburnea]|uniref:hypothetical protein n=1 Tax=Motilimonas eburnea TaxID=1737488 RepID=UPI001E54A398|nr:hypothetical protein [Motilimonas eburnea]MCE2573516.1 hypothetical protein [Motilimonas eburnea]